MADNESRHDGANAVLAVLRQIEQLLAGDADESVEKHFRKRATAIAMLVEAAGPLSDRAAGVLEVVAELIVTERQIEATLDLRCWLPAAPASRKKDNVVTNASWSSQCS